MKPTLTITKKPKPTLLLQKKTPYYPAQNGNVANAQYKAINKMIS